MDVIAKLADVDPVFREVASALYPEIDPRELYSLSKALPDSSAVHVNSSGPSKKKKAALVGGLVAGTGIEAAAAGETIGPLKRDIQAFGAARKAKGTLAAVKPFVPHGVGLSRWGSGTKAALMGGNLLVGLGAARELSKKPPKKTVAKADTSLVTALADIVDARRKGEIDTDTALRLINRVAPPEPVAKAKGPVGRLARIGAGQAEVKQLRVHNFADREGYQWEQAINRGRRAAGVAAFGGAGLGAYKVRSKQLRRKAAVVKSADEVRVPASGEPQLTWDGEISKVNEEKRQVFGWCSLSSVNGEPVVDLQDDYVPIEEIEKSAYKYVISSRKGGDMHKRVGKGIYAQDEPLHTADLIESVIVTPDKLRAMGVPDEAISKVHTGWWVGFQVNDDEQWAKVKSGERAGFSIHGTGTRKMVEA